MNLFANNVACTIGYRLPDLFLYFTYIDQECFCHVHRSSYGLYFVHCVPTVKFLNFMTKMVLLFM